ncbi:TPA: hypothetical protein ACRZZI_004979 [Vibrio harveyi]
MAAKRRLMIELDERTFALLELLAFGMEIEQLEAGAEIDVESWKGYDAKNDDFAPAVRRLLNDVAGSLATGVRRPGAWERQVVEMLTGWNGMYNPGMAAECIKEEVLEWSKK